MKIAPRQATAISSIGQEMNETMRSCDRVSAGTMAVVNLDTVMSRDIVESSSRKSRKESAS